MPQATGHPGDHPAVLLKAYFYGYINQNLVEPAARLEREAELMADQCRRGPDPASLLGPGKRVPAPSRPTAAPQRCAGSRAGNTSWSAWRPADLVGVLTGARYISSRAGARVLKLLPDLSKWSQRRLNPDGTRQGHRQDHRNRNFLTQRGCYRSQFSCRSFRRDL